MEKHWFINNQRQIARWPDLVQWCIRRKRERERGNIGGSLWFWPFEHGQERSCKEVVVSRMNSLFLEKVKFLNSLSFDFFFYISKRNFISFLFFQCIDVTKNCCCCEIYNIRVLIILATFTRTWNSGVVIICNYFFKIKLKV